ncbi:Hypothetical predicted protein [Cloeon dipterum]|uniref:Caspase family p10 domain-containing protein n=1 Tax=Cloeon dipterum TaxID=197152 RepID=A0A8S1E2V8_9INSE|nr:Hypothetical predicted protein [Cloeon dipterum]
MFEEDAVKEYNELFRDEFNAFHFSVVYNKKEIAEYLFSKSPALKHVTTREGKSPLQLAVEWRQGEFLLWLAREVDDDLSSFIPSSDRKDWTEDDHFIYDHFLLLRGDLTKTDERGTGKTQLHCAAQHGHLQLVREFIAKGADVTAKDADGWNALHFACVFTNFFNDHDNSEVVKLLHLNNPRLVKETTNNGETALHILASYNFARFRANEEKMGTFNFLVDEAGVDLEAKDSKGCTAEDVANEKHRSDTASVWVPQPRSKQTKKEQNWNMEMEEILKRGEAKGRPTGPADLGFFQSESGKQNADNVFILVVHYDFKNTTKFRNCDAPDVKKLEITFGKNRNCNFRSLYRPKKEVMLDLLGSREKLLRLFSSKDIPSVFVLFFLSHGGENGVIDTDYWEEQLNDFISFTTEEVFNSLKKLHGFEKSLKLVNFGPCRGEIDDAKFDRKKDKNDYENGNKNSCRITSAPEMPNTVIVYSTVETTRANTNEFGSWFVNSLCELLSQISEDKPLLLALTSVQHKMHKASIAGPDFATNHHLGQTPEVKMFSLNRSFSFSRPLTAEKSVSRTDSRMGKAATITSTSEFFSWKSDEGQNIRGRRAFVFYERPTKEVQEMEKALRQNLDFDTRLWKLKDRSLEDYFIKVREMEHDVGCVFTCIFGQVSEKESSREVCILVDGREILIMDILHGFVGSKNNRLIGKPKIFFIIDQKAQECDSHSQSNSQFEVSSTNHSGWLVMILKDKDLLGQLIGIFEGDDMKKGKSLQELLEPLLTTGAKKELTLLNSTLQYLLDFPEWPRTFVKPDFKLRGNRKTICFEDLIKERQKCCEKTKFGC